MSQLSSQDLLAKVSPMTMIDLNSSQAGNGRWHYDTDRSTIGISIRLQTVGYAELVIYLNYDVALPLLAQREDWVQFEDKLADFDAL
ncbi:hypothetical protein E4U15_001036 [Claviceps sp. LM218 group G6]|nr:hypothetical protein E4U15_001036 [Claviceps sp. LM218 group G6]